MTEIEYSRTEKTLIMSDLQKHAEGTGIIDPRDLKLVVDRVKITEDGYIYGSQKAVEELRKESPHLFKPTTKGVTVVQKPNAASGTSASDLTRAETTAANKASRVWREALGGDGRI
jgi:hypothetical protein